MTIHLCDPIKLLMTSQFGFRAWSLLLIWSIPSGLLLAQSSTWTTAKSGNWTDTVSWSNGVPDGVGHVAVISPDQVAGQSPMTISSGTPITLGELSFGPGPRVTVNGSSLLWETGTESPAAILVSSLRGSALVRLQNDQVIQDQQGLTIDIAGTSALEITGRISGGALVKQGTGGVVLNADNINWDAPLRISDGTIVVSHANALGTVSAGTTVDHGLLRLTAATDEPIQVFGGTLEITADQRGPVAVTAGNVQLRVPLSNSVVSLQGGTLEWRGSIDPRSVLNGSSTGGTLLLTQTATFNGTGQVFDWRLLSGGDNLRLGTTDTTTLPTTLSLIPSPSGQIRLGGGKGVMTVRSSLQDFQGQPTSLDYVGPGDAILAGSNTFSGRTTVRDGMLTVDSPTALGIETEQASDGTRVADGGVLMFARQVPANERILLDGGELRFGTVTIPVEAPIQIESLGRFGATTGQITLRDATSNGGMTEFVAGRYLLDRSLALQGPIHVAGAQVIVASEGALGTGQFPTTVQSGNLIMRVNSSEPIHVEGGRLTIEPDATYTGRLTASGGTILPRGEFPENVAPELQGGRTTLLLQSQNYRAGVTGTGSLVLSGGDVEQTGKPFAHNGGLEVTSGLVRMLVANSYSGVTEIRDSNVIMAHPQAFGTITSPTRILPGGELSLETDTDEPLILAGGILNLNADPAGRTIQVEAGSLRLHQPTRADFHIVDGGSFQLDQGEFLGSFSGTGELRLLPHFFNITLAGDNSAFQGPIVVAASGNVVATDRNAFGDPTVPTVVEDGILATTVPISERFILRNRGTINQLTPFAQVPDFDDRTWTGPSAKSWSLMQNTTLASPMELQRTQLNAYADVTVPGLTLVDNLAAATARANGNLHVQGDVTLQRGTLAGLVTVDGDITKSSPGVAYISRVDSIQGNLRVSDGDLIITSILNVNGPNKRIFIDASPFARVLVQDATHLSADIELADGAGRHHVGSLMVTQSDCCAETVLDGNLTIAGQSARIAGGAVNGIPAVWAGQLHGGNLEITGALQIATPQTDYRGALTINGGRLSFAENGSLPLLTKIQVLNHASLSFGDEHRTGQHTSRLNPNTELFLGDALVNFAALNVQDHTERVGRVELGDGYSTVLMTPFENSRLQLSSLQRTGRGMLDIQATDGRLEVNAPVPMTHGIVNWATMNGKLATYFQEAFRELQPNSSWASALATDHALIDSDVTMASDRTVASLTFQSGTLDLGGHQLTVGTGSFSSGTVITNGTLSSGDSQGELFLNSARISASIVDQPGRPVHVLLNNTELSGTNTYTGSTTVLNFWSKLLTPNSLPDGTDLLIGSEASLQGFYFEPLVLGKLRMVHSSHLQHPAGISFTSAEIEGATMSELIGAGPLTKRGHGLAIIEHSPNYSGAVRVEDGSLYLAQSLGTGTITLAGGELKVGAGDQFTNPLEIDSGRIRMLNGPLNVPTLVHNQLTFSGERFAGKLSGKGTLIVSAINSSDLTTWTSDTSDFQGTTIIDSGVVDIHNYAANLQVRANGALQLHEQSVIRQVNLQGGTIRTTTIASGRLVGDVHVSGNAQLEVVNGTRLVMSGITELDRAAHLSLVGEGTIELAGPVRLGSDARFVGLQP